MKKYLIAGTQIDGEHEYDIFSIMESEVEPDNDKAARFLIEMHAFGFRPENSYDIDDFSTYGDGLTAIVHRETREISDVEADILQRSKMY